MRISCLAVSHSAGAGQAEGVEAPSDPAGFSEPLKEGEGARPESPLRLCSFLKSPLWHEAGPQGASALQSPGLGQRTLSWGHRQAARVAEVYEDQARRLMEL